MFTIATLSKPCMDGEPLLIDVLAMVPTNSVGWAEFALRLDIRASVTGGFVCEGMPIRGIFIEWG